MIGDLRRGMSSKDLGRMADWLRRGATMLSESCPECSTPLFRVNDEVWCPKCNKQVVIVKEDKDVGPATRPLLLSNVERVLLSKTQEVIAQIKDEKDYDKLKQMSRVLLMWLKALERIDDMSKESD